jgi:carotenoid cleavage dioxygenase
MRERDAGRALYTGLRDINPIWEYLLPRLAEKVTLDAMQPDSAFFVIQSKNTSSNSLLYHAGRLLSTFESGAAYELALTPELETLGVCDFNGSFGTADFWGCNFTAHAKTCGVTGELVYMGYNLVALGATGKQEGETTVTVGVIDPATGKRTRRREIKVQRPSMQHDVAITPTKTILIDGPLVFNLSRVIDGGMPFKFEKDLTMRIGYLSREDENDGPHWVDTNESCFAYHVVNAYEEDDIITLDVCKSDETNALGMCDESESSDKATTGSSSANRHAINAGRDVAALWRWRINTKLQTLVSSERMCKEYTSDFPCINRKYTGLKHRYAYSVAYKRGTEPQSRMAIPSFDSVLKHDMDTGETTKYELGRGKTCGDIIFVPETTPRAEDDGYLLVLTHIESEDGSPDDGAAELLILSTSGRALKKQCVVDIPVRIPYGFHCEYVPGPLPQWPL